MNRQCKYSKGKQMKLTVTTISVKKLKNASWFKIRMSKVDWKLNRQNWKLCLMDIVRSLKDI